MTLDSASHWSSPWQAVVAEPEKGVSSLGGKAAQRT